MESGSTDVRRRVDGVELEVTEAGPEDGPLVILLHGFPDARWTWRHQIGPLAAQGYRVVAPDQRGYGHSDKPPGVAAYTLDALVGDVVGLAAAYGRDSFRLVGHDWGGVVAWGTGIRHPEQVERLVIMNAPHPDAWLRQALRHPTQALRSLYVALFQVPRVPEAVLGARRYAALRRALVVSSRSGLFSPADLDRYAEGWAEPGALTAMLNYYRALRFRLRRGAPARPRPPTLVVWGGRDAFLEPHLYRASLDLCDRGEGLFVDDASHWVHLEEADVVTAALLLFFDEPPPASSGPDT